MAVIRGERRESLNLRVPPELKRRIETYAEIRGVSVNAASTLLLDEGLRVKGLRR